MIKIGHIPGFKQRSRFFGNISVKVERTLCFHNPLFANQDISLEDKKNICLTVKKHPNYRKTLPACSPFVEGNVHPGIRYNVPRLHRQTFCPLDQVMWQGNEPNELIKIFIQAVSSLFLKKL